MSRKDNSEEEQAGAIDLTPMLDVVFIMLIFFIVTATFIKETGIEVNRPEATMAEDRPRAQILIAVNENNEIWIDRERVDREAVRVQIERLLAENPNSTVVIQADEEASVQRLADITNAAREAGVLDVAVSTDRN
ncbi:ExbD/TolR family protein [Marinimicrobium alkaliphilum]|uniref:ExbD/TolR family protein n=1 Tax=Marinimicrobium alkaliphilum TaxID=2202654 RepID=UPI000DBA993F|nr:biopolymer transporter ExbD [Marinimicrobium alkaliphilum]